jgi:lipopolysaccharide transport system ATP-binding protein
MRDVVVQVDHLSKMYHIGAQQEQFGSVRAALRHAAVQTLRRVTGRETAPQQEPFWALRDLSFEVRRGDVLGVIGHNGSGKSTLLRILSRITTPTTGRARVMGRVGSLLEVGTGFHPELTGRTNVYLNGAVLGMSRDEITRRFDEIVAFAEIAQFIDTAVKFYSSGMYMRLAFAVAAHLDTDILLVDEVLAVGDAAFQAKCLGKMDDITAKQGRTILFVSHAMSAIRQMCNRAILLEHGCIVLQGDVEPVVEQYLGVPQPPDPAPPLLSLNGAAHQAAHAHGRILKGTW